MRWSRKSSGSEVLGPGRCPVAPAARPEDRGRGREQGDRRRSAAGHIPPGDGPSAPDRCHDHRTAPEQPAGFVRVQPGGATRDVPPARRVVVAGKWLRHIEVARGPPGPADRPGVSPFVQSAQPQRALPRCGRHPFPRVGRRAPDLWHCEQPTHHLSHHLSLGFRACGVADADELPVVDDRREPRALAWAAKPGRPSDSGSKPQNPLSPIVLSGSASVICRPIDTSGLVNRPLSRSAPESLNRL